MLRVEPVVDNRDVLFGSARKICSGARIEFPIHDQPISPTEQVVASKTVCQPNFGISDGLSPLGDPNKDGVQNTGNTDRKEDESNPTKRDASKRVHCRVFDALIYSHILDSLGLSSLCCKPYQCAPSSILRLYHDKAHGGVVEGSESTVGVWGVVDEIRTADFDLF
jgi:hypothetical protein